jgi:predicted short-subunit dehydrogenase-like oxidoreductase (DUF2520 family)
MNKRSISIIGTGALGSVLAQAASEAGAGFSVYSLYNRTESVAGELSERLDVKRSGAFPARPDDLGEVVFLTVPDRYIKETALKTANIGSRPDFDGRYFIHCSGTLTSDVLSPLQKKGASAASFHPLQTFTSASGAADFNDIYIDVEGDEPAISFLNDFAAELGSKTIEIDPAAKPYLHAAAVTASNYLVALMENAGQIAEMGGMNKDEALRALMPLMQQSAKNIRESETLSDALSGPVARGDASTIADHLKLLEQNPRLLGLYKEMGHVLVGLTEKSNAVSGERSKEMRTLFDVKDADGKR